MALQHYALTIWNHVNPNNASDPANGFYVCKQVATYQNGVLAAIPGSTPQPATTAEMSALVPGSSNPFSTQAAAQAVIDAAVAYYASQNKAVVAPGVTGSVDTLVAGPVLV